MQTNVAIITGGTNAEREISLRSAQNVAQLLRDTFEVQTFDFPTDIDRFLDLRNTINIVIPLIHGRGGEDGTLQGFCEVLGLAYLFSGVEAQALALDKEKVKIVVAQSGLKTARSSIVSGVGFNYQHPVVVKPVDCGSSVGTSIVRSQEELDRALVKARRFSSRVMVEDYIEGQEFTVSIIDKGGAAMALPVVMIITKNGFFDFASKYDTESLAEEVCPAPISNELTVSLQKAAITAHKAISCRQVSRSDFIVDKEGTVWFLEINTIPGMTGTSLLPKALLAGGTTLKEIVGQWITDTL